MIIGIDQGSSHTRAVLFTEQGRKVAACEAPIETYSPHPGWVTHNPQELLESTYTAIRGVLRKSAGKKIAALGLANQRSTIVCWDGKTGEPCSPAISWQTRGGIGASRPAVRDNNFTDIMTWSKQAEHDFIKRWEYPDIQKRTGLPLTPFYSATKINALLNQIGRKRPHLRVGTVNTFLIWHLTQGKRFFTDPTNAQRTLLYNIIKGEWDNELLRHFKIPRGMLPDVVPNTASYGLGVIDGIQIPIFASIGDQQSSVIGLGMTAGDANMNYGTGGFLLVHTGETPTFLPGLLVSIACADKNKTTYLIEGTVNAVGTLFTWLMQVGILRSLTEISSSYRRAQRSVFCLPALSGLGAPYWKSSAQGILWGLTSATTREEIIRSAVEAIAYRMNDIYQIIPAGVRRRIKSLIATGGGARISSLVQFQADLLGKSLCRVEDPESTVRGAAFLAGCAMGLTDETRFRFSPIRERIAPRIHPRERAHRIQNWKVFVNRGMGLLS